MDIKTLGIDLAKNVFQLHGVDKNVKTLLRKRLPRIKLAELVVNLPPCLPIKNPCQIYSPNGHLFNYFLNRISRFNGQCVNLFQAALSLFLVALAIPCYQVVLFCTQGNWSNPKNILPYT
jgi:hypothetical protein